MHLIIRKSECKTSEVIKPLTAALAHTTNRIGSSRKQCFVIRSFKISSSSEEARMYVGATFTDECFIEWMKQHPITAN